MMDNLKIISDDLGLYSSVNDGIIFALKNKLITGASIMANGEAFNDALEKLRTVNEPNIGIHFVLVEEEPFVAKRLEENHQVFFIKYILGLIDLDDIEKELQAQLNKVIQSGIKISFINSHQHLHLLPRITDIIIKLAKDNNIEYIRTVTEPFNLKRGLFRALESLFLTLLSNLAKNKINKMGIGTNDFFFGFLSAGSLEKEDVDLVKDYYSKNKDKIIELGCHLGYENDEMKEKYKHWGSYNWQSELKVLENANF